MSREASSSDGHVPAAGGPGDVVRELRAYFASGATRSLDWRLDQLDRLDAMLVSETDRIIDALVADLGRSRTEGFLSEVFAVRGEVRELRRGLPRWSRSARVRVPVVLQPARALVRREPLGVVAVIGPWNYPVNLTLVPLASAIAAGNCTVVKPSEFAPASAGLVAELVERYLDPSAIRVLQGGPEVSEAIVDAEVDHVFFTGSTAVGRLVMQRAAAHLTPVTLELGGKSPVIVDADADVALSARRIAWGKFLNAGQSCLAPDYVLVHDKIADAFIGEMRRAIEGLYGGEPKRSADYGRIVNDGHVARLDTLLGGHGGSLLFGGEIDRPARYVAPTLIAEPSPTSALMSEEIFGPILPVIRVPDLAGAVRFVAGRPAPLSIYLFSRRRDAETEVLAGTRSGSVVVNTTMEQFADSRLPFGGVGPSGIGTYHGRFGFETFSQLRPVFHKATRPDLPFAYPPFGTVRARLLRRVLSLPPPRHRRRRTSQA